jgi:hypothetical protein
LVALVCRSFTKTGVEVDSKLGGNCSSSHAAAKTREMVRFLQESCACTLKPSDHRSGCAEP